MDYRWVGWTPDGLEYFQTREAAEEYVCDWFTERLADTGEGTEDEGWVARIESTCAEDIVATCTDDTENGEWCRDRGCDYMIGGYKMLPAKDGE